MGSAFSAGENRGPLGSRPLQAHRGAGAGQGPDEAGPDP